MVSLKIKDNSPQAQNFLEYAKKLPFVEIEESKTYNPEFVKMMRKAEKEKSIRVNPKNVWESIK
jgi:hypothetical protein